MSTIPVTNVVWRWALALRNAVSSTPTARTPASRAGSSTSGVPWSRTAAMTVAHPTPNAVATWATPVPVAPDAAACLARARSVHDDRAHEVKSHQRRGRSMTRFA